jgi:tRNA (guanine37-N1)-methyltransferase
MKGHALKVPRSQGEETREALRSVGVLRNDLEILREDEWLVFPLLDGVLVPAAWGEVVEREFAVRDRRGPHDYRELLELTPEQRALLPRSFDVVGDMVLVRVPPELESEATAIGKALLEFVPGARVVGADHGVHGAERRRSIATLAGSGGWRGRHRENGLDIEVDLERAYFSPRLAREHALVAESVRAGDRVYDLCCGVGPFTLAIRRDGRAASITALDSNRAGLELLRASLDRQRSRVPVQLVGRPVEAFAADAPPVERVIFNLPLEGIKYLPSVARTVARGGRLFYYEVVPRDGFERRGEAIVRALGPLGDWRLVEQRAVHPYSPASDLAAFVLERPGGPA